MTASDLCRISDPVRSSGARCAGSHFAQFWVFGVILILSCVCAPLRSLAVLKSGASAVGVLGQFAAQDSEATPTYGKGCRNNGPSRLGFDGAFGVALDTVRHRMFVSDCTNNRVLVFALTSTDEISNKVPTNVLGQTSFETCVEGVSEARMHCPEGLAYDEVNDRLFVGDQDNNRVLVFNTSSISDGMNATAVLGQSDFTSSGSSTSQSGLNDPGQLAVDTANNRLFVSDTYNNRVMIFSTAVISNGMNASNVLGQTNFTNGGSATTQSRMTYPYGLAFDAANNRLFVGMYGTNGDSGRVLVYDTSAVSNGMNASFVIGKPNFTGTGCNTSQTGMCGVSGLALDPVGNRLFVSDHAYRVMVFRTSSISNGMAAEIVLGQANFTSRNWNGWSSGLVYPIGLAFDSVNKRLIALDSGLFRMLVFQTDTLTNGQGATRVLGQANFTSSASATTQAGASSPGGVAFDSANQRVFVADTANNRVLVHSTSSFANGQNASFVLGQANFTTSASATTQSGMNQPRDVAYDPLRNFLFVSDYGNNRVLVFNITSGITDGMNATYVLGQSDFISGAAATSSSRMNGPVGLAYDETDEDLFVADSGNNRVLLFYDTLSTGMPAANVLGQSNFTNNGTALSQSRMNTPLGLSVDPSNNRLFVADSGNHRVLSYDIASVTNGENANRVLGQANFTSNATAMTQAGMNGPKGAAYDRHGNRVFVSDAGNNRILIFDTLAISNGENAAKVLGQTDFISGTGGTTQTLMTSPAGLSFDSLKFDLYVADTPNNRVLRIPAHDLANEEGSIDLLGQYTSLTSTAQVDYGKFGPHNNSEANPLGLESPEGMTLDSVNHRLFVADAGNKRVLVYNLNPDNSLPDRTPDNVLGQSSLYGRQWFNTDESGLQVPTGVAFDSVNNRLFVSDCSYYGSRVAVFDTATISDGEDLAFVLGQPNLTTLNSTGVSQAKMNTPCDLALDQAANRLYVLDTGNNRVLIYDTTSISNGMNASFVIGQTNFANSGSGLSQSQFNAPYGIALDTVNKRLFVSDKANNRILVFDTTSVSNGMSASFVIGQTDFVSNSSGATSSKFNGVEAMTVDPLTKRLFVADSDNNRVLIFNYGKLTNGMAAVHVLGQANFSSSGFDTSPSRIKGSWGLYYDRGSGRLFVSDSKNHRVLIFEASHLSAFPGGYD